MTQTPSPANPLVPTTPPGTRFAAPLQVPLGSPCVWQRNYLSLCIIMKSDYSIFVLIPIIEKGFSFLLVVFGTIYLSTLFINVLPLRSLNAYKTLRHPWAPNTVVNCPHRHNGNSTLEVSAPTWVRFPQLVWKKNLNPLEGGIGL